MFFFQLSIPFFTDSIFIVVQSDHADIVLGLEVMYVAVSDGNHFVGGSKRGCQFLKDCGTYVPYSFVGYLSFGQGGSGR